MCFWKRKKQTNMPKVDINDINCLVIKHAPGYESGWGIWNNNKNEWLKNSTGKIETRLLYRNIRALLDSVIAFSILEGKEVKSK